MSQQHALPRRSFLLGAAAGGVAFTRCGGTPGALAAEPALGRGPTLATLPRRVFKAPDPGKENAESWYFHLMAQSRGADPCEPRRLDLEVSRAGTILSRHTHEAPALEAIRIDLPLGSGGGPDLKSSVLRVHGSAPAPTGADTMVCALRGVGPEGEWEARATVALLTYEPRTPLVFPFVGRATITQGGVHNGGHANRSGQFALDAIGLTPMYAPQVSEGDANEAAAGWGREIVAPGSGVVVVCRADRPDQPRTGVIDPEFLLSGTPGDPGNHVVIDHENGEFSMIAHMQAGSVRVREGQRVVSSEPIGRLGNSGETNFPHVHYQLMDGPLWPRCDALPCRFANVRGELVRGAWFEAKAPP